MSLINNFLQKPRVHGDCEHGLIVDLIWSDPNRKDDTIQFNKMRGISTLFGKSVVDNLCTTLAIDLIIRAHEMKEVYVFHLYLSSMVV